MAGPWVDTHGHLFMLDDPSDVVLGRAADAGVRWIMCPGVDAATSEGARAIAEAHPTQVAWSTGLHPHDAERWPDECDRIAEMAPEAAAIGECGLDFYRNLAPRDAQIAAFSDQLALGSEHGLPVIIHCRDAFADVYELLGEADLGSQAVLHCWTGGPRWTNGRDTPLGCCTGSARSDHGRDRRPVPHARTAPGSDQRPLLRRSHRCSAGRGVGDHGRRRCRNDHRQR